MIQKRFVSLLLCAALALCLLAGCDTAASGSTGSASAPANSSASASSENIPSTTNEANTSGLRPNFDENSLFSITGTSDAFEPFPCFFVDFLRLKRTSVTLLGRKKIVGLWHFNTLDFGNIQHFKFSAAGIPVFGLVLDCGFLPSRTGSCTAAPACVIRFCGHPSSPPLITLLILPFSHT